MSGHRGDLFSCRMGVVGHHMQYGDPLGGDMNVVAAQTLGYPCGFSLKVREYPGVLNVPNIHPHNLVKILDSVKSLTSPGRLHLAGGSDGVSREMSAINP